MPLRFARNSRGFTLVEIVVSIAAIGILMALLINVFGPELRRGTDPLYSIRAAELGQSYLEEILGKKFDKNSPPGNGLRCGDTGGPVCSATLGKDGGETTHITFDDVDDYNGPPFIPTDQSGNARPGYAGFTVQASVVYAGADLGLAPQDAKLITVTVNDSRGINSKYVFSAYKTNF